MDDETGFRVDRGGDLGIELAADSVFRAEQGDESYTVGGVEKVQSRAAVSGFAGVIGQQADALADQTAEVLRLQHVDSGTRDPGGYAGRQQGSARESAE